MLQAGNGTVLPPAPVAPWILLEGEGIGTRCGGCSGCSQPRDTREGRQQGLCVEAPAQLRPSPSASLTQGLPATLARHHDPGQGRWEASAGLMGRHACRIAAWLGGVTGLE